MPGSSRHIIFIRAYLLILMFKFPFSDPKPLRKYCCSQKLFYPSCSDGRSSCHVTGNEEPWLRSLEVFPPTPSYITSVLGQAQWPLGYDVCSYPMWICMCPELEINRTCQEKNDENYFVLKLPSLRFYFLLQIQLEQVVSFALRLSLPFKKQRILRLESWLNG